MHTQTAEIIASKITAVERFYGTRPENLSLIEIADLRTKKSRGNSPVTLRFAFDFQGREDYVAWVKAWKEAMNDLTHLIRVVRSASQATRKRNNPAPEAYQRVADASQTYSFSQKPLLEAFKAKFPELTFFHYANDHADIARFLLSMRKAAKIASARQREAALAAQAA